MPYQHVHNQPVNVALVQMSCTDAKQPNVEKALARIAEAAERGANIVCLQELFTGPYFCQTEDHRWFAEAESIPGPTSEALAAAAKKHGVVVIGSLFEKRAPGLYHNTAVILDADGSQAGLYRKMHIPDDPLYYEKFYFTPGDTGFRAWKTQHATIGVLICWDQWFPEGARLTAMQGAEILFYPTAIGWHASEKKAFGRAQHDSWELIQRSHAVANGCFVCAPNRVGREIVRDIKGKPVNLDGIEFWGQSFIASPDGAVMKRASVAREQVVLADCDLGRVEFSRTHWPFLRDRRVDAYQDLTKRFIE
jgi:N-carbamoylputrescine amidase